ncbi:MAG: hypothetical protein MZV70_33105 [Desulfobacterales bacterium]|nr:hypothetical protein [Desulfobacterales bacterium]
MKTQMALAGMELGKGRLPDGLQVPQFRQPSRRHRGRSRGGPGGGRGRRHQGWWKDTPGVREPALNREACTCV